MQELIEKNEVLHKIENADDVVFYTLTEERGEWSAMRCALLFLCPMVLLCGCGKKAAPPPCFAAETDTALTEAVSVMLLEVRQIMCVRLPEQFHPDMEQCIRNAEQGYAGTLLKRVTWQRTGADLTVSAVYAETPEHVRAMRQELKYAVDGLAAGLRGFAPPVQILLLHDNLISKCEYDADAPFSDSAYGVLQGAAVCGGYAEYFSLAAECCGIPALTVSGFCCQNGVYLPHAWNLVQLDGAWYHIDCTGDEGSTPQHDLFLCTDTEMLHGYRWEQTAYPPADGTAYRYETIVQQYF